MVARVAEAFVPGPEHYYKARPPITVIERVRPILDGIMPCGFASGSIDPHSVYPGLSPWNRRVVREARIRAWTGTSYAFLVPRERELLEAGL